MPPRRWRYRIQDILDAIDRVADYVDDLDEESFAASSLVVDAVLRNLTVIGEATRYLPEEVRGAWPNVPWQDMQGVRNIVVHEYFGVSLPIVWQTAKHDLPDLRVQLQAILENGDGESD